MEDKEYDEDLEIATIMNTHFQSVFTEEVHIGNEGRIEGCTKPMESVEIPIEVIKQALEDLDENKAQGPDEITPRILKACKEELLEHIHKIILKSIEEGKVPGDWRRADIVPIHKGGNAECPGNYRPVSLTSVVAKICES